MTPSRLFLTAHNLPSFRPKDGKAIRSGEIWPKAAFARKDDKGLRLFLTAFTFLAICGIPASCQAHHFKGLPHFSYFENYPQVPQDEFLGQAGQYAFSLVLYDFQGIKRQDVLQPNNVRLYLVIYNLKENRVYNGPLTLNILDRGRVFYSETFDHAQEESLYEFQHALPTEGKYSLEVLFPEAATSRANIPFVLSSQKIHWGKWIAAFLIFFVTIVAIGSRKARVAQDRKENRKVKNMRAVTT